MIHRAPVETLRGNLNFFVKNYVIHKKLRSKTSQALLSTFGIATGTATIVIDLGHNRPFHVLHDLQALLPPAAHSQKTMIQNITSSSLDIWHCDGDGHHCH
jgi:hypothetical protein